MPTSDLLIRTKLRQPHTRPELVPRPRLQERIAEGLHGPLTLVVAPAGFGKTTVVAACVAADLPVAWLSLDKNDNQVGRFLRYLAAALHEVEDEIGREAAQLLAAPQSAPPEAVMTSLINELDITGREITLVLDDYQFISSQAVHDAVAFLLEHCPSTFHLVISTRSDPPLPLSRLRARGQTVELRAADLSFTEPEAAKFLNEVMDLSLDAGSVAVLEERTEGWIAGLQMAALSMRDRADVLGFIEGFSGTNRFILDYLLEEVLTSQPLEIQHFLLCTSILDRLTAPLCEAVLEVDKLEDWIIDKLSTTFQPDNLLNCQPILEYLERANLFLMPLDDERQWYRYHHLFADLLRARMDQIYPGLARHLHVHAAVWYEQNGLILEAIQHASMAPDDEMVERLIEQHYMEMVNRGEMSGVRFWMGKLDKELVYRRPWLCLYEAFSRSWFGQLEEANILLNEAEKRIRSDSSASDTQAKLGYHAYVQSRVIAMQGDTRRAIEYCLTAREKVPADKLALQIEIGITLGYEYFLYGDFIHASETLHDVIRLGYSARAINNPVAAYALLARMQVYQGQLHEAYELFQKAAQLIYKADGQYLGATGLIEVGTAALLCERNDVEAALVRIKQGLEFLPLWGKADDLCLAYTTLSRIQLALGDLADAAVAIEKASQLIQTGGVFSEARGAVETAKVKLWLAQGDLQAAIRWAASKPERLSSDDRFGFENEPAHLTLARILIAQQRFHEATGLLSQLEEAARSAGRMGRVIDILLLRALAMQGIGDDEHAFLSLAKCLTLAGLEGYMRVFLDEGYPLQLLLAQWLAHAPDGPMRDYAVHLLKQFEAESLFMPGAQEYASPSGSLVVSDVRSANDMLVEPLSPRELEVLQLIALGKTNLEIAQQLIVSRGTIKAHAASIYRKLDVNNRTEAVARARQLDILP